MIQRCTFYDGDVCLSEVLDPDGHIPEPKNTGQPDDDSSLTSEESVWSNMLLNTRGDLV